MIWLEIVDISLGSTPCSTTLEGENLWEVGRSLSDRIRSVDGVLLRRRWSGGSTYGAMSTAVWSGSRGGVPLIDDSGDACLLRLAFLCFELVDCAVLTIERRLVCLIVLSVVVVV